MRVENVTTWRKEMFPFAQVPGAQRALGVYRLADDLPYVDLDDAQTLVQRKMRPSQVIERNRPYTQGGELAALGARLEARQVGTPVGAAAVHERVGLAPVGVREQQRRAVVGPALNREGDRRVDPVGRAVDQQIEETFKAFAANMKRSFHMNGQQVVEINGDSATGITYCQVKHVREEDSREAITDSSVRYHDEYIRQDGRWYINTRIARFTVNDKRTLQS